MSQGANLGISFSTNGTTITLDVNDSIGGTDRPSYYKNGGTIVNTGTGTVNVDDVIELWGQGGSPPADMLLAEITVPTFHSPCAFRLRVRRPGAEIKIIRFVAAGQRDTSSGARDLCSSLRMGRGRGLQISSQHKASAKVRVNSRANHKVSALAG